MEKETNNREVKEVTAEEIYSKHRFNACECEYCLQNKPHIAAMQEYANNQVAEKEREIEELKKLKIYQVSTGTEYATVVSKEDNKVRFGIYTVKDGLPHLLLHDSGPIDNRK